MSTSRRPREMRLPGDGVVTLTAFTAEDATALLETDRDPEHRKRFDFPEDFVPSLSHCESVIARWERERAEGERLAFAVRDARTGEFLGGCELLRLDGEAGNLSYWTRPSRRRRGVASHAVALACRVAFEQLGLRRIEVLADPDNVGSRRAALGNGFAEVGTRAGRVVLMIEKERSSPEEQLV